MDWVDRFRAAVEAKGKHSAVALEAGVDPSALSDILRRTTNDPKLQTIARVCRVCGVTVGWVLGEKGFELGEADYAQLQNLAEWTAAKIEEREQHAAPSVLGQPKSRRSQTVKVLPAVATARGETWTDEDEIHDREIPIEYRKEGANAVFVTRGDSMIDAGIFEGDILFVRKTRNAAAANGRLVVCRLDGTFTVKRLGIENGVITLFSENRRHPPVTINEDAERYAQIGVVVGIARDLLRRR
ncbi:MAG: S24 family peptidase [Thermoanaerobaculia bacterium]